MYGLFYLFLVGVLVVIAASVFAYTPASKLAAFARNFVPVSAVMLGAVLTLAGRGIVGLPMIGLGLALWQRGRSIKKRQVLKPGLIRTAAIEVRFAKSISDKLDGVDGSILSGSHEGKLLSQLSMIQMEECFTEIKGDKDSALLLEAYLDRKIPGWRTNTKFNVPSRRRKTSGSSTMTQEEAYQVLGLEVGASSKQISDAHTLLMDMIDPDRSNDGLFATKINVALQSLIG